MSRKYECDRCGQLGTPSSPNSELPDKWDFVCVGHGQKLELCNHCLAAFWRWAKERPAIPTTAGADEVAGRMPDEMFESGLSHSDKLNRLLREWKVIPSVLPNEPSDKVYTFAYWLCRHSGWRIEPPKERP